MIPQRHSFFSLFEEMFDSSRVFKSGRGRSCDRDNFLLNRLSRSASNGIDLCSRERIRFVYGGIFPRGDIKLSPEPRFLGLLLAMAVARVRVIRVNLCAKAEDPGICVGGCHSM